MKYLLLIIAFLCSLVEVDAQNLKGRIVDRNQRPIEGANIFVRNMLQGVAANENGEFQLHLPAGNYTCEVTAIGYEKRTIQVTVSERPLQMDWVLQPMTYLLPEVRVSNKGEDPAYSIMRQAIALAPFHRNQVKRYTAEVYTKGKAQIEKVPKVYLMGVSSENRKKINTSIGKLLVLESVTEVKFEAPAHYEDKVLAFNSTIPEEIDPSEALSIITASIYDPSIMGMISPLSPGAFSQYRFRLMESYLQDGKAVNKIKVEPKKKNLQLFAGELHIEDQGWSVVNFDLTAEVFNSDARFKVIFHELTDGVYLPTSYDIGVDVKFAGIVAGGRYYSSLKYSDVEAVKEEAGITAAVLPKEEQEPVTTKQKRTIEKLEELTQKEVLSTRDAYQVARLTQQVLDQSLRADTVSPLEVRSLGASYRIETDALAARRDSLFWQRYRTIPLNQEELLSYRNRDSIREIMLSDPDELPEPGRQRVSVGGKLMWGGTFRYNNGVRLRINGLLGVLSEYNFVDGFWLGQQTTFSFPMAPQRRFELNAGLHYVTARKSWVWNAGIVFPYALRQNGRLAIDAGDSSIDYKQETGSVRLENSLTSFVGGYNFLKFYRGQYLRFSNEIDLANGLRFSLGGKYEKRTPLENEISFNLFDKTPKSNIMTEWSPMPSHHSASLSAALSYNPRAYYRMEGQRKQYTRTSWPTFTLSYVGGFSAGDATSDFHRLEGHVRQSFKVSMFSRLTYTAYAGKFLSDKEVHYPDYKHFSTSGWWMSHDAFRVSYLLGDYYNLATKSEWIGGALNFRSSYLLLKNLTFLQPYPFDETLHLRYLWTPHLRNYIELGYTIGFKNFGRAGVFVGFERMRYESVGFRFHLPILNSR